VAHIEGKRNAPTAYEGNLKERDHLEDQGVDGTIILKWTFKKWYVGVWTGLVWLEIEKGCGLL